MCWMFCDIGHLADHSSNEMVILPFSQRNEQVRVCFEQVRNGPVSIMALQTADKTNGNAVPWLVKVRKAILRIWTNLKTMVDNGKLIVKDFYLAVYNRSLIVNWYLFRSPLAVICW